MSILGGHQLPPPLYSGGGNPLTSHFVVQLVRERGGGGEGGEGGRGGRREKEGGGGEWDGGRNSGGGVGEEVSAGKG